MVGWQKRGLPPMTSHLSVHTGPALVGNMGSAERLFYTCIGDTVNTAARLKGVNRVFGTALVASAALRDAVIYSTTQARSHAHDRTGPPSRNVAHARVPHCAAVSPALADPLHRTVGSESAVALAVAMPPEFVWRPLGRVGLVGKSQVHVLVRHIGHHPTYPRCIHPRPRLTYLTGPCVRGIWINRDRCGPGSPWRCTSCWDLKRAAACGQPL